MGMKINEYHALMVEKQEGLEASSLEHRMMFIRLNKITFVISVSAYYLYPALKKAGK